MKKLVSLYILRNNKNIPVFDIMIFNGQTVVEGKQSLPHDTEAIVSKAGGLES